MPARLHRASLVACSVLLAGSAAGAQSITVPPSPGTIYTCGAIACGQTFTAPTGGVALQSFSLTIQTQHTLSFELYAFSAPMVSGSALFAQELGPTVDFETLALTPSGGVPLTGGAMYVALLRMDSGEQVAFQVNTTDAYEGGARISCPPDLSYACENQYPTYDIAFTAVFSPAMTPVPEPATLALTGAGLLLLAGFARRRRS